MAAAGGCLLLLLGVVATVAAGECNDDEELARRRKYTCRCRDIYDDRERAGAGPACETARCGKGHCVEEPGPLGLDAYRCDCDAGWSNMLKLIPASPCTIPNSTPYICLLTSQQFIYILPQFHTCVAVNCGPGGQCVKEEGFSYHCACSPGFVNMLNLTELPCIKNCAFGKDCAALGLSPASTPAPAPTPAGTLRGTNWLQL
uniref:EGF-like domain-containing protein n=1 Tax=Oryza barthii TaxID=65489 RepID=A0A0D3HDR2_9ORYZ